MLPEENGTYEIVEEGEIHSLFMNLKGFPYKIASGSLDHLTEMVKDSGFISQKVKRKADKAKEKVAETTRTFFGIPFGPRKEKIEKEVKVVEAEEKMRTVFPKKD